MRECLTAYDNQQNARGGTSGFKILNQNWFKSDKIKIKSD